MAAYLISFLPVFLSTRCIILTEHACFGWGISTSQFFFAPLFCFMVSISLIRFCYNSMWFQLLSVTLILSIVLWCLLPLSTSISWLYNMDWVLESKQIVFLVFQIFAVIFLHNFVLELLFNKFVCCDWYMWYIHSSFGYCGLAYI